MAAETRKAFSNASSLSSRSGVTPCRASSTARAPVRSPTSLRRECVAGTIAEPGSAMPSDSAKTAIVLAVPITLHTPTLAQNESSRWSHSSRLSVPSKSSGTMDQMSSVTTGFPRNLATLRGPAVTMIAGLPALAAPIN